MIFVNLEKEISGSCSRAKKDGDSKGGERYLPFGRRPCGFPAQVKYYKETISAACGRVVERCH